MRKSIWLTAVLILLINTVIAQNVGIGTSTPAYPLTVANGGAIVAKNGAVELGTYLSAGAGWLQTYSNHPLYFSTYNGNAQISLLVNGNVGIGTTTPSKPLEVVGDAVLSGNLTVNSNKGIFINSTGSAPVKYWTQQAVFTNVGLPAFGTSIEATIAWPAGIFSSPPKVMVGDITSTGGTTGQLWRMQLVTYDVTNNNCHCVIINTWNGPVNYSVTWNIICIGT